MAVTKQLYQITPLYGLVAPALVKPPVLDSLME